MVEEEGATFLVAASSSGANVLDHPEGTVRLGSDGEIFCISSVAAGSYRQK